MLGGLGEIGGERHAELRQGLAYVETALGNSIQAVHRDPPTRLRHQQRREEEPRQLPLLAGIGGPVEIDARRIGRRQRRARGADEARDLLPCFLLDAQQHQERAELFGQRFSGQDHGHRLLGFLDRQGAAQRLAAA